MNDDLDRWLRTHNDQFNARINARIDLDARRRRVSAQRSTVGRGLLVAAAVILLVAGLLAGSARLRGPKPLDELTPASGVFPERVVIGIGANASGRANGQSGFDYDLANWLARELNFLPSIVEVSPRDGEAALRTGQVQLVIDAFSITDDRKRRIAFAGPYMLTQQGIMVRAADTRFRTINDLADKAVCAAAGSTSIQQLRGRVRTVVEAGSQAGCVQALLAGAADAVAGDQLVLYGVAKTDEKLKVVSDLVFGPQERYGIGLAHENKDQCTAVRDAVERFVRNGSWADTFRNNMPDLSPDGHKPDLIDPC